MDKLVIAGPVRQRLEAAGYNADDARVITCQASFQPLEQLQDDELAVVASLTKEAGPPMITDGKPTILRVVAWMCHGDIPNQNRDAFVKEELQDLAPALFRAPDFGVMDFNHSAVRMFSDEPKVIGVWYRAEYAFDQKANDGKGAWGILTTGMMFAWAFPEHATRLLGEQVRAGFVEFSMAAIPGGIEYRTDANGTYAVLHNPVFFTLSALDVPAADPDAKGAVSEEVTPEETLRRRVAEELKLRAASAQEARMDETLEQLKAEKAAALAKVEELSAEKATSAEKLAAAEAKVADLETRIAELETARQAAANELETAKGRIAELETQLAAANEKLVSFEAEKAAEAKAAKLAERIASLPEEFQTVHKGRAEDVRARVEAKWASMSDEEWEQYKADELLGYVPMKKGYAERTEAEGRHLPAAGDAPIDIKARATGLIKR